jgi:integrase
LSFCEAERIRLANHGAAGMAALSVDQLAQAAMAFNTLKPHGIILNEVVEDWLARRQAAQASIPFEAAMDAFMQWGTRSSSYARSIRQTRNRLDSLHGRLINTIYPADLTVAMDAMPASVRNLTIRILGGLFNFCIKRGYCAENPCRKLHMSRREPAEIEIYTLSEVATILQSATKQDPQLLPFLAVSFFCGIRLAEALRLNWSAIDLHEHFVKLPAAITKTRQGRHIEISQNCHAWLSPHVADDRIVPCSSDVLRKRLTALKARHCVRTIKHGPRHCFASYLACETRRHQPAIQVHGPRRSRDDIQTLRQGRHQARRREVLEFAAGRLERKQRDRLSQRYFLTHFEAVPFHDSHVALTFFVYDSNLVH